MGIWGGGLYSDDFAMDLRSTIRAVARLPYNGDQLAEMVVQTEPAAAGNPEDEQHAVFWLVLADQFATRGIQSERVRNYALALIESDADGTMRRRLGASETDLTSRRKKIEEVRTRITAADQVTRKGTVLQKPQPLLMSVGDVLVYPTFSGRCRNPYFASKEHDRRGTGTPSWTQDSWAAMVIVDCGRAFGFLSWYRPLTVIQAKVSKPSLNELLGDCPWKLRNPGTCSPIHFRRLELERIGRVAVDPEKLRQEFPNLRPGTAQAVSDISIANNMHVLQPTLRDGSELPTDYSRARVLRNLACILDTL